MPKAKFKRKGAPLEVLQKMEEKAQCKFRKHSGPVIEKIKKDSNTDAESTILLVPEEIICLILENLPGTYRALILGPNNNEQQILFQL